MAARLTRRWPDFRRPPQVDVELPDQPSSRRLTERSTLRQLYPLTSAADALGLTSSWAHRTVIASERPGQEDYPWLMKVAKACLLMSINTDIPLDSDGWESVAELDGVYGALGHPAVKAAWDADPDATFAALRVSGPNPMFLQHYPDQGALRAEGLETEVAPGSYAVSYDRLFAGLTGADEAKRRFFSPAIAVFHLHDGQLRPTGVQLRSQSGAARWFPADGSPAWRLAMMYFNSCDMLAHELVAHFLWTHVVAEKFLLATGRNLTWRHPLRHLLAPHLANTLNTNNNATPVLIQRGGLFDRVFGSGERGKLLALTRGDSLWTFDRMVPERHLANRGVADLPHYPYRDAALRLWAAVATYVQEYVALWYTSDEQVLRDTELQAWATELSGWLGETLPAINDLAALRLVLTAVIFNVMQHGFVNLLQFDTLGYPPVFPVNLRVPVPDDPASVTDQTVLAALPSVGEALQTIRATHGFSVQYGELGQHIVRFHKGPSRAVATRFVAALKQLSKDANKAYQPADPARIGNSIDA